MDTEKKEAGEIETAQNNVAPREDAASDRNPVSELVLREWSVVTYKECIASGLTYKEAALKMAELTVENIPGLCIVTDHASKNMRT